MAKLIANTLRTPAVVAAGDPPPTPEEIARVEDSGPIRRGARGAFYGLRAGSLARDELDALIDEEYGKAALIAQERAAAQRQGAAVGPRISSLRDINSTGDAVEFAAGALGQGAVTTAPAIAGGVASALALRTGLGRAAIPNVLRSGVSKLPKSLQGYAKGLTATPGAAAASVPMEAGELANTLLEDPVARANMTPRELQSLATRKGLAAALPESLAPSLALGKIVNNRAGRRTLRGTAADVVGTMGTEAVTEGTQNLIGQYAHRVANPDKPYDLQSTLDEAAAGAIGGGGLALPGAALDVAQMGAQRVLDKGKQVVDVGMDAKGKVVDLAKEAKPDVLRRLGGEGLVTAVDRIELTRRKYLSDEVPPDLEIDRAALARMSPDEQVDYLNQNDDLRASFFQQRNEERAQVAVDELNKLLRKRKRKGVDPVRKEQAQELLAAIAADPENSGIAMETLLHWERTDLIKQQFTRLKDFAEGFVKGPKKKKTRSSMQGAKTEDTVNIPNDRATIELVRQALTDGIPVPDAPAPDTAESRVIADFFRNRFSADAKEILQQFTEIYGPDAPGVAARVAQVLSRVDPSVDPAKVESQVLDYMERRTNNRGQQYALVRDNLTNDARVRLAKLAGTGSRHPVEEVTNIMRRLASGEFNDIQQTRESARKQAEEGVEPDRISPVLNAEGRKAVALLSNLLGNKYSETRAAFEEMQALENRASSVFSEIPEATEIETEDGEQLEAGTEFDKRMAEKGMKEPEYVRKRNGKLEVFDNNYPQHKADVLAKMKAGRPGFTYQFISLNDYVTEAGLDPVQVANRVGVGAKEAGLVIDSEKIARQVMANKSVLRMQEMTDPLDLVMTEEQLAGLKYKDTTMFEDGVKRPKLGTEGAVFFVDSKGKEFAINAGKLQNAAPQSVAVSGTSKENRLMAMIVSVLESPGVDSSVMPYVYRKDPKTGEYIKQEMTANNLPGSLRVTRNSPTQAGKAALAARKRAKTKKLYDKFKIKPAQKIAADRKRKKKNDAWAADAEVVPLDEAYELINEIAAAAETPQPVTKKDPENPEKTITVRPSPLQVEDAKAAASTLKWVEEVIERRTKEAVQEVDAFMKGVETIDADAGATDTRISGQTQLNRNRDTRPVEDRLPRMTSQLRGKLLGMIKGFKSATEAEQKKITAIFERGAKAFGYPNARAFAASLKVSQSRAKEAAKFAKQQGAQNKRVNEAATPKPIEKRKIATGKLSAKDQKAKAKLFPPYKVPDGLDIPPGKPTKFAVAVQASADKPFATTTDMMNFLASFQPRKPNTRSSAQSTRGGPGWQQATQPSTPAERRRAEQYLEKVLGPRIAQEWVQSFGKSGEWVEDGGRMPTGEVVNLIRLSTEPGAGVLQVAAHEAMHEMFWRLLKSGRQETIDVLMKAANSPAVVAQLNRLLRGDAAALAQIANGASDVNEERLSYMFQFWASGDLKIGPNTENVFQKIWSFLRKLAGYVHNDEQAIQIMQYIHDGKLSGDLKKKQPSAAGKRLNELHKDRGLKVLMKKIEPVTNKGKELFYTADGDLRASDNPKLIEIANLFNVPGTGTEESSGYLNAKPKQIAHWLNRLNNIVSDLSKEDLEVVHKSLQTNTKPGYPAGDKAFDEIRKMLSGSRTTRGDQSFFTYLKDSGLNIGRRKDYYPVVWDSEVIASRRNEFVQLLLQNHRSDLVAIANYTNDKIRRMNGGNIPRGTVAATAQSVAEGITRRLIEGRGATVSENADRIGYTPHMSAIHERKLDFLDRTKFAEFERKDIVSTLSSYLVEGVKHAEYAKRFGTPVGPGVSVPKLQILLSDAEKIEIQRHGKDRGKANMLRYKKAVMAMEGTLGADMSPRMRQLSSAMLAYQNLRLLPLSLFASFVDPLGIAVRGGTMADSFNAFKRGVREVVASYTKAGTVKDEAAKLAERLGTVDNAIFLDTLGETYSSIYMTGMAKKINDALFRFNGMEGWNRGMRIAATQTAIDFIKKNAATPGVHSGRWLDELGIKASDVKLNPDGSLKMFREEGLSQAEVDKIQGAVARFVDSSILRPNAAQRPSWASDPHWALLFHLKQFTYTFQKVILSRVKHEWQAGNLNAAFAMASYIPFMIAADIIKGMITSGGDEPDYKKNWGVGDYVWNGVERSAILGVGQFGVDVYNYGFEGLSGPTVEQAIDLVTDPLGKSFVRALPANSLYKEAVS